MESVHQITILLRKENNCIHTHIFFLIFDIIYIKSLPHLEYK